MTKRIASLIAATAAVALLASCTLTITPDTQGTTPPTQTSPTPVQPTPSPTRPGNNPTFPLNETLTYQCSNSRLLVRYPNRNTAEVFYTEWHTLTRNVGATGRFVYSNSEFSWELTGRDGRHGELLQNRTVVRSDCSL